MAEEENKIDVKLVLYKISNILLVAPIIIFILGYVTAFWTSSVFCFGLFIGYGWLLNIILALTGFILYLVSFKKREKFRALLLIWSLVQLLIAALGPITVIYIGLSGLKGLG